MVIGKDGLKVSGGMMGKKRGKGRGEIAERKG
jgi:hypothetical protein